MAAILCFSCRTNTVQAPSFDFFDTSVEVEACGDCRKERGVVSANIRMSAFANGLLDVPTYTVRHRDGLVSFAG